MNKNGIRRKTDDGIGWITLDRPEVLNRFEGTMREDLLQALRQLSRDPAVRCIALTGAGEAFSAGADLEGMAGLQHEGEAEEIARRVELGAQIVRQIQQAPKPVVAVLNGIAAGAGMNLALACDLRIGSERSGFAESFVRIGLVPDWGGMYFLARLIGTGRAAELMMTGERIDARQAHEFGLLEQVFPESSFDADSARYLRRLARGPSDALAEIKTGLTLAASGGLDAVLEFEADAQPRLFLSENCREGIRAFLDKRTPTFR